MGETDIEEKKEVIPTKVNGYSWQKGAELVKPGRKIQKFSKKTFINAGIRSAFEIPSLLGLTAVNDYSQAQVDLTQQGLDLIVQEFEQSGAANIQTSATGITDFDWTFDDLIWTGSRWELANKLDFSAVPQLYVSSGEEGFNTLLGFGIPLTIAQILLTAYGKTNKSYIKGPLAMIRRFGMASGLGQIIGSYIGLRDMPYTITGDISTDSLIDYSKLSDVSAVDITPLVNQGLSHLEELRDLGIGLMIGFEAAAVGFEAIKYGVKKRISASSLDVDDLDRLKARTSQ